MNNLILSFAGTDLTRLRTLVTAVGKQIALAPGATVTDSLSPRTELDKTWSRLVEMLDLGNEPEMRTCPVCKHHYRPGATRCGHCWTSLNTSQSKANLTV
jgi:hypothetical protein